jgi:hypothetical protein
MSPPDPRWVCWFACSFRLGHQNHSVQDNPYNPTVRTLLVDDHGTYVSGWHGRDTAGESPLALVGNAATSSLGKVFFFGGLAATGVSGTSTWERRDHCLRALLASPCLLLIIAAGALHSYNPEVNVWSLAAKDGPCRHSHSMVAHGEAPGTLSQLASTSLPVLKGGKLYSFGGFGADGECALTACFVLCLTDPSSQAS